MKSKHREEDKIARELETDGTLSPSIHRSYLGFVIYPKWVTVNPKRAKRFKDKVRRITRRNAGRPIEEVIRELNPVLRGWMNCYRLPQLVRPNRVINMTVSNAR